MAFRFMGLRLSGEVQAWERVLRVLEARELDKITKGWLDIEEIAGVKCGAFHC